MGENDVITKLYSENYDCLLRYARRRVGDWALAEDLVESTMETALEKADKVAHSPSPRGWLLQTLRHKIIRELEKAYHHQEIETQDEYIISLMTRGTGEDSSLSLEGLEEVLPACCPPAVRDILSLRYVERRQYDEIGEKYGITAGAAQQRLLSALKWLRDYFSRHDMPGGAQKFDK